MKQKRNQTCNCGSGKKFKNCCMLKSDNNFIKKYYVKIGISIFVLLFLWISTDRIINNDNRLKECEEMKANGPNENQKNWEWCQDCCIKTGKGWKPPGHNAKKNNEE